MKNLAPVLFFSIFLAGAADIAYTQINQGELQQSLAPVEFINYAGPHAKIETREQIRQIGVPLGQAVQGGAAGSGAANRYFVIHSVSGPDGDKLDADIIGLGSAAAVDHVRNLRFILQGYLQEAYSYSANDALLLAEYITIYNAVYRGNWDYFSARYKQPVLDHLTPEKAGLAVRYSEWPGNTLMLIPLGMGGISSIDTTSISDDRVIEEMRKEDDRGVEQRRDMVDFKEREAAEAEQKAAEQQEVIAREEQAIAGEKSQLAQEQQQIEAERRQTEEDRRQLEEDKAAGELSTETEAQREEAIVQREEAITQRETEAEQKSDELEQREEELVLQREEAAKQEEFAEQKAEEARQDRESIAQDQQAIIEQGEQGQGLGQDQGQGLIGIIIEQSGAAMGRLVSIDPNTRQVLRRSPLDTISVRTLTFINGKVLAIAGENQGNGAVRLIEVDTGSLEMAQQGDDDLHPASLIWVNGSDLYAITANPDDGTLNLGRFDTGLALQTKSAITVHPNAAVSIQEGSLLTQKADGTAVMLNPADLTEK